MNTIDPADVLAVLEERPYLEEELVVLFGPPAATVHYVLKQLVRTGQLKRVGADRRWALAAYQAPMAPAQLTTPARVQPEVEDVDEDLEDALDEDAEDLEPELVDDEEPVDSPAIEPRRDKRDKLLGAGGARLYPTGTRKPKDIASGPGWWVAYAAPGQRAAFQQAAAARNTEMCEKSPAWRSQTQRKESDRA